MRSLNPSSALRVQQGNEALVVGERAQRFGYANRNRIGEGIKAHWTGPKPDL